MIEDRGDFAHFNEERRAPARKIITRSDAREDAVGNGQLRLPGGNEAAYLRQQHDQRGLPQIRRLAPHVGACNQEKLLPSGLETKIVGDEALALLPQKLFNHRMTPANNEEFSAGIKFRARIAAICGQLRERGEHVKLRDARRSAPQTHSFGRHRRAHIDKKLSLNLQDALVRSENLSLIFLQLSGSKSLGVDQCLFALVVRGTEMQAWFRHFTVLAKILVTPNLQLTH